MTITDKLDHCLRLIPLQIAKAGNNPTKANRFPSSVTLETARVKASQYVPCACHVLYDIINIQKRSNLFQKSQANVFVCVSRDMNSNLVQWQEEECEAQVVLKKNDVGNQKAKNQNQIVSSKPTLRKARQSKASLLLNLNFKLRGKSLKQKPALVCVCTAQFLHFADTA